jgi:hypothetical protein
LQMQTVTSSTCKLVSWQRVILDDSFNLRSVSVLLALCWRSISVLLAFHR